MELNIIEYDFPPQLERAFSLSMVIKSFKGRKDVEVHLFRPAWDKEEEEEMKWDSLLGSPMDPSLPATEEGSRKVLMESFTAGERDRIVEFLKRQYGERLAAISSYPLSFPVPRGLVALSDVPEGKSIGIIRFEKLPSYDLDIPLHGLFDLSQHEPIIEAKE
jgi:hypothetical protein